jgi:Xaa-Pro aminopeptidase
MPSSFEPSEKLNQVSNWLEAQRQDAAFVSFSDLYQNEFPKPDIAPVQLTLGFMGSCGTVGARLRPMALIGRERSAVFVDSRYTLEAEQFFANSRVATCDLTQSAVAKWLKTETSIRKLTVDPRLFTAHELGIIRRCVSRCKGRLDGSMDFYAIVRAQRRTLNAQPASLIAGDAGDVAAEKKIEGICRLLGRLDCTAYLTTNNEEVAWLLNVRASENPFLPCPNAWLIIRASGEGALYFPGPRSLIAPISGHLAALKVKLVSDQDAWLASLARDRAPILIDQTRLNGGVHEYIKGKKIKTRNRRSPVPMQMSVKSSGEIKASTYAHVLDGVAKTRFLYRVHTSRINDLDEYQAITILNDLRRENPTYVGPSFPWVSCAGPNGAKPHYKPRPDDALPLHDGSIFLIDSGGQYAGATTDVTRTVYIGDAMEADPEFRRRFTLVLKSFISGSASLLPMASTAAQLDAITRAPMWSKGVDFGHGTGHGVGAGLSIHETPIVISSRARNFPLRPGMIFSIEPGSYERERWGIRIENLVVVEASKTPLGSKRSIEFRPLTVIPIQVDLIDKDMLSLDEIEWLNTYHAKVRDTLEPHLLPDERSWLRDYTREL